MVDIFSFDIPFHKNIKAQKNMTAFHQSLKMKIKQHETCFERGIRNALKGIAILAIYVVGVNETSRFRKILTKKKI